MPERPNIIFILADDLGFETLGADGGVAYYNFSGKQPLAPVKTPYLDALARNGMLFKYCFCTPVCSPSRVEFLTGKYNYRSGFVDICGRRGAVKDLDPKAHPTIAARLKAAGYVTAVAGKWHVGEPLAQVLPTNWDVGTDYPHPKACGFEYQCVVGGHHLELYGPPEPGRYTPERLQHWLLKFLESQRQGRALLRVLSITHPAYASSAYPTESKRQEERTRQFSATRSSTWTCRSGKSSGRSKSWG